MALKQALIILAAGAAASSASAQFWEFRPSYQANRISNNGVVVGDNLSSQQYFMWSAAAGGVDIGGIIAIDGPGGQASISNDGQWVSGTHTRADGFWGMGRYNTATGVWSELPGITGGGQIDNNISSGWGISGDGQTAVGLGWFGNGRAHAISWNQSTGTVDLGSTTPGSSSRANAVNYNGTVIGGWQDNDNGRQGAVWINGSQQLISDADGFGMGEVYALSDNGTWAVGYQNVGFFGTGSMWIYNTNTQEHQYLGNIADGMGTVAATAVNDAGTMAVGGTWGFGPAFWGTAVIWTEDTGVIEFAEYLDSVSISYTAGYTFSFVTDMSSDGTWFTGWGTNAAGQVTSWAIHVPTPAGVSVLALGGLLAARRRRA